MGSPTYGELAKALCEVQGEHVTKDQTANTGQYSYTYADLAAVWKALRASLKKHGIAVIQMPEDVIDGQTVRLKTRLIHTSGEWIESTLPMPFGKPTPQAVGSALTYARRYALCAMLGVATEEDDDAAAAQTAAEATTAPVAEGAVAVTKVDQKSVKDGTRYLVWFSDGEKYSTFRDEIGQLAVQLAGTGEAVDYDTEQRGRWTNLASLRRVAVPPASDATPTASDAELAAVADEAFGATDPPHPADEPIPF